MEYITANKSQSKEIFDLVQNTITTVYPRYYPKEVVDFFCELHNENKIRADIEKGCLGVLIENGQILGTGSYNENHITRVYVNPDFQGNGFGSIIMQNLENQIALSYNTVNLDASLPASRFYERHGYVTQSHEKYPVENGVVLVYEIMQKSLPKYGRSISYNGKCFVAKTNTENGEVDGKTLFTYHQDGSVIWADYNGGEIVRGNLIGTVDGDNQLNFHYQHININNEVRIGCCHSVPKILENGKIELFEEWQWLNGDKSKGSSILIEK